MADKENQRVEVVEVGTATQYPILPAYAMTIHRAQGQTYDAVELDPNVFAEGMAYVGLSRCCSYTSLSLISPLKPEHLMVDKTVLSFYQQVFKHD